MAVRAQFEGNNEVGVFAKLTNAYCLVAIGGSENFYRWCRILYKSVSLLQTYKAHFEYRSRSDQSFHIQHPAKKSYCWCLNAVFHLPLGGRGGTMFFWLGRFGMGDFSAKACV